MRGLTRRWLLPEPMAMPDGIAPLNLPPLLVRILLARGMAEPDAIAAFCEPRLVDLHPPSLLPGVDEAAEQLVRAAVNGKNIVIYGDYDVDGICATAVLFHTIRAAVPDARITTYVPHRLEEGYGLNTDALRQIREDGGELVVSVDCGITARAEATLAREIGLELIITDHHNLPRGTSDGSGAGDATRIAPLPETLLVHPALPGSQYPFPDLCGAGVAFKLAWRFATCYCNSERVSEHLQKTLMNMLPLVALGTIADVVPLIDENRILTTYGLRLIKQTELPGLRALIEASDLAGENIDSEKVGFVLAPRLNACGRMGHAREAMRMLTDAPPDEAAAIAHELTEMNQRRQQTERRIADQASRLAEDCGMTGEDRRAIVLADPSWHPGVIGIVCTRLVERFGRPAVLLQLQDEICRGSARSIEGYSIHKALTAVASHLQSFGGHDAAAGMTLRTDDLDAFTEALIEHANTNISVDQLTPAIHIDCDATLEELDLSTVRRIAAMSPFGKKNRRPTLRIRGATLAEPPKQMGSQGRHLSLRLRQDCNGRRRVIRGVWWRAGRYAADLAAGMTVDLAVEPKCNEWNGRVRIEAEVRDVMVREP
jgi:single-stranded-DNA-specific exonuclease